MTKQAPMRLWQKLPNGKTILRIFEVSSEGGRMFIDRETTEEVHTPALPIGAQQALQNLTPRLPIELHTTADGSVVIDRVSPEIVQIMKLLQGTGKCDFDGCDALLCAYQKELEAMGGAQCSGCAKGALDRKYITKFSEVIPMTVR